MTAKCFFDTNILVYGHDDAYPAKQDAACRLVHEGIVSGRGVISTQVMQEFYSAVTRKGYLTPLKAKSALSGFQSFEVVAINPGMILEAIDCSVTNQISFWDGLVIVAAAASACETLYTEDLTNGQVIHGVTVCNPFIANSSKPQKKAK